MEFDTPEYRAQQPSAARPHFYIKPKMHKGESEKQGRPIFKDVEYVEIFIAGDKDCQIDTPVKQQHIDRWPEQYRKFKAGLEDVLEGTPIEEWAAIPRHRVMELRALNIRTVEEVSALSDSGIQNLGMDGRQLVAKAKAFLASADDHKAVEKYAAENERLKTDIEMLKNQIAQLGAKVNQTDNAPVVDSDDDDDDDIYKNPAEQAPRQRGRPRRKG